MTLINAAGATTSEAFTYTGKEIIPPILAAVGLAGTETAHLEQTLDNGATWADVYANGSQVKLDTTHTVIPVNVAGKYRVVKSITGVATRIDLLIPDQV